MQEYSGAQTYLNQFWQKIQVKFRITALHQHDLLVLFSHMRFNHCESAQFLAVFKPEKYEKRNRTTYVSINQYTHSLSN